MSRDQYPRTREEARAFMENLDFDPPASREKEDELLAQLPEKPPATMTRSIRVTPELEERISEAALRAGVPKTVWMRQAIETALAEGEEDTRMVSLADVKRALSLVRPARPRAA